MTKVSSSESASRGGRLGVALAAGVQLIVLCGAIAWSTRHAPTPLQRLFEQVPDAEQVLSFEGRSFAAAKVGQPFHSDTAPAAEADERGPIEVRAPNNASQPFTVGSAGLKRGISVTIPGAAPAAGSVERGVLTFANVFPDVDLVAARDPGHFELGFVVRDAGHIGSLPLRIDPPAGGTLEREVGSAALLVRAPDGRPLMRVEQPRAFDARGEQRSGEYEVAGSTVSVRLRLSGLEPPILIDPIFAIPFWTIISDERAPGANVYDAQKGSTETKAIFDATRGAVMLTRPARSQQLEDSRIAFGRPSMWQWFAYESPNSRVAGRGAPQSGPAEQAYWWSSFWNESETFHWINGRWVRSSATGLEGVIDPALAVEPSTQDIVSLGGLAPDFVCENDSFLGASSDASVCHLIERETTTFELEGGAWVPKPLASPPPLRVRGAASAFRDKVVLFGGRAAALGLTQSAQYGAPFPDNLTDRLLNDTWLYDRRNWERVGTSNPPPPREAAQLVFDTRRQRLVLIGGVNAAGVDAFDIWEFDGSDWVQRVMAGDSSLPVSLQTRSGMMAVWHPVRQTTVLFGGIASKLDSCTLSEAEIRAWAASPDRQHDAVAMGCFGGYVHDFWEWDGQQLRQLSGAAYGGTASGLAVFRQLAVAGGGWGPAPSPGAEPAKASGASPLWPWRYDARPEHFKLRTQLEQANLHEPAYSSASPTAEPPQTPRASGSGPAGGVLISPLFASRARPHMVFDAARGKLVIVTPQDASVFETDGASWADVSPATTPFARGTNDFFAATWDATAKRIALFDPQTAGTWYFTDAGGWQRATLSISPPIWNVDPAFRREHDFDFDRNPRQIGTRVAAASVALPQMTFDRARGKTLMLYLGQLWQLDEASWTARAAPPGWDTCAAATLFAYDGARQRAVAVGCHVPAQTYEWDGATWSGPYSSPYDSVVWRTNPGGTSNSSYWSGTLQTTWAHPNALTESRSLGGVSMLDAEGVLRTWTGSEWKRGPKSPSGRECYLAQSLDMDDLGMPNSALNNTSSGYPPAFRDFVPTCLFPPLVEDQANTRLLAFRDSLPGSEELRLQDAQPAWNQVKFTKMNDWTGGYSYGNYATQSPHPHPLELFSAEHLYLSTLSDPNGRELHPLTRPARSPEDDPLTQEGVINNLYWPFRLLPDPTTGRIRVLTHRGMIWELGAEQREGLGEPCVDNLDCVEGYCEQADHSPTGKVCCDQACRGACMTCELRPGLCTPMPAGSADPAFNCAAAGNQCAPTCTGELVGAAGLPQSRCDIVTSGASAAACGDTSCVNGVLSGAGQCREGPGNQQGIRSIQCDVAPSAPCSSGLGCADAKSCKTACTSPADCAGPYQTCAADGKSCISDGKVCHNNGECPKFNDCAADGKMCLPDAVLAASRTRNVEPTSWVAPPVRSAQQLADRLKKMGFPVDAEGRVLFPGTFGDVQLAFNPNLQNPATGIKACVVHIEACVQAVGKWDECVASMPRCEGATPWLGDPAGSDCCPSECLVDYFVSRGSKNEGAALEAMMGSSCYPGLQSFLEGL